jgi:DNA-binding helix-hairpin-helix protein with protein kinase domain
MNELLKIGQVVTSNSTGASCKVEQFLGAGGQGEVYRAILGTTPVALKWYRPEAATAAQRATLEALVRRAAPDDRFLWPMEVMIAEGVPDFGYLMPLRDTRYCGIVDLMKGKINPPFRSLATAGYYLATSYLALHSQGLSYRDISFGNVFFNPDTGDVLICDNDNVAIDSGAASGVYGTPMFMAPEIVRGEAMPSTQTDLFSLAVLLFHIFVVHHPLNGLKQASVHCLDEAAQVRLYGKEPIFIFDPDNPANRPPDDDDYAMPRIYWPLYPEFLRKYFTRAFTTGLNQPEERVRESEWRGAMVRLRDSIVTCANCGSETFYDDEVHANGAQPLICWNETCGREIPLPLRLHIDKMVIPLTLETRLFPHHTDGKMYDFSTPTAQVTRHPSDPNVWGLKNLTAAKWVCTTPNNTIRDVEPQRSITLAPGTRIQFGSVEGRLEG